MLLWDWGKPVLPPVGLCFATKSSQEIFLRRNDRLLRQLQLLCYTQRPHPFETPTGTAIHVHVHVADKGDYYDLTDGLPQLNPPA
jgi:hypothetical protein